MLLMLWAVMVKAQDAQFVFNAGQWPEPFEYLLKINNGSIYFEDGKVKVFLIHPYDWAQFKGPHHSTTSPRTFGASLFGYTPGILRMHTYEMHFINSNTKAVKRGLRKKPFYHNYFLGKDPKYWRSEVPVYSGVSYENLYPGINVHFYDSDNQFKYDYRIAPGADPSLIKVRYAYADSIYIDREGNLIVKTNAGDVVEKAPYTYQIIDGQPRRVACHYVVDKNVVTLKLGTYNPHYELVIDPTVVFSTFTGSTSDNWGFSATFDNNGNFYAGGIVFGNGYPTTSGAFQTTFNSGGNFSTTTDVSISKFNPAGTQLIYSTYLGGSNSEQVHSMVVNSNNELIVYGITGSSNFPITPNAAQTNFAGGSNFVVANYVYPNGSDIFITRFNASGSALIASTFLGGNGNDGHNAALVRNYGDYARGEVIVDSLNNIYVTSCTNSNNLILPNPAFTYAGQQDAILVKFTPNLNQILWGTFYGGAQNDAGYSVKIFNQQVFICGGTTSTSIPTHNGSFQNSYSGSSDGFLARFSAVTGAFQRGTYFGTAAYDQVYFIDHNRNGEVYGMAQTLGSIIKTPIKYGQSGRSQVIFKMNAELSNMLWITTFGSGPNTINISPAAFNVDECFNIMLSGWGGAVNSPPANPISNGSTTGLPLSPDAYQSSTDGSDFYFMVLGADGNTLKYATYFGGSSNEHVDGGTSRFSPEGIIYQAICAACQGGTFPTTPGVFSPTRGGPNCNLGAVKIDFDNFVKANASVQFTVEVDSVCNMYKVVFDNKSINAQNFLWILGNGQTSTLPAPSALYVGPDTFRVKLIAHDTLCNQYDTIEIAFFIPEFPRPKAEISTFYRSCDSEFKITVENLSTSGHQVIWNMGDGTIYSGLNKLTHKYPSEGSYNGFFVLIDTICNRTDTVFFSATYSDTIRRPEILSVKPKCPEGSFEFEISNTEPHYIYVWDFGGGNTRIGRFPIFNYTESGNYIIKLTIIDTLCNREYKFQIPVTVDYYGDFFYIPNTFTPNGDGINDVFYLAGAECLERARLEIYNRWGQLIFETDDPFNEFWDGTYKGKEVPQGVYPYIFYHYRGQRKGTITLFR
ncbi:gliding motility-associated C-terminal domain-containing protein [Thermaurantimonas sp.]|uniref:gliding motility-associated C-terminal domain-containing protein n=1 Tax=Thermaurantimonas sp. TaxID=2681568 RepID=UPI00391B730A